MTNKSLIIVHCDLLLDIGSRSAICPIPESRRNLRRFTNFDFFVSEMCGRKYGGSEPARADFPHVADSDR